ncbi:MAG: aminoacyl-tRNA hydrolase [Candidatus Eisenbacteria bacterium]|nr:aminoacyl-tRNA hydrolase [Candidatus Eisenbacteria bacterium]
MLAVIGLGNVGSEYEDTRHNVGFRVIEALAGEGTRLERRDTYRFIGGRIGGRRALLVEPTVFMNRSGIAVARLIGDFDLTPSDMLVVSDDVHLPLGRIRIRSGGGDGGQKGLASIIRSIGTEDFPRLRLGVGSPGGGVDLADYVLDSFDAGEREEAERMIDLAVLCVRTWVTEGVARARDRWNRTQPLSEGHEEGEASKS